MGKSLIEPNRRQGRRASAGRGAPEAQAGVTLVEVLVGVAILGIAISTLVGSLGTTMTVSSAIEQRADVNAEARRLAELLRAYDTEYVTTAPVEDQYLAVLEDEVGERFGSVHVDVQCGNAANEEVEFSVGDCVGATELQRISVTVTARGDQNVAGSVTVVKRKAVR